MSVPVVNRPPAPPLPSFLQSREGLSSATPEDVWDPDELAQKNPEPEREDFPPTLPMPQAGLNEAPPESLPAASGGELWDPAAMAQALGYQGGAGGAQAESKAAGEDGDEDALDIGEAFTELDQSAALDQRTHHALWANPGAKMVMVGGATLTVFVCAGLFLNNMMGGGSAKRDSSPTPTADAALAPADESKDPDVLSVGQAKAELAVGRQARELEALNNRPNQQQATPDPASTPSPPSPPPSPPDASVIPPPVVPQAVAPVSPSDYAPSPYSSSPPPPVLPPSLERRLSSSAPAKDPMEAWSDAASLGSYGQLSPIPRSSAPGLTTQTAAPGFMAQAAVPGLTTQASYPGASASGAERQQPFQQQAPLLSTGLQVASPAPSAVPSAVVAPQPTPVPPPTPAPVAPQSQPASLASELQWTNLPLVDANAEAAILNGRPRQVLTTGARANATLTTPMAWINPGENRADANFRGQTIIVTLSEPLLDSMGQVALPAGTQVVAQVNGTDASGLVSMSVQRVMLSQNGQQTELTLAPGAIEVRGDKGNPLIARRLENRGRSIAGMDIGLFALSGVARGAELLNQAEESVVVTDTSTTVSQDRPQPNILAGVLEGGAGELRERIGERNERAIQEALSRSNPWYLKAGTRLQVFVNRSTSL